MKILSLSLFYFIWIAGATAQTTAADFYKKGVELRGQKNTKEALAAFGEAVRLKPDYPEARYEMGWCYNDLKQYTEAIISLRAARNGWSHIPKVHAELGYAFEKTGLTDSAIRSYNRCLELKPDYSMVHKQLGYIAYDKNDYTTAIDRFNKYQLYVKTDIKDYLFWYRKGFSHNALKNYDSAKTALQKSLEFKTDYINTYLELGFACTKLKQDDNAIAWFEKAMAIDPKSHIPYNGIAEVYRDNKKNMDEAMNWYKKTLAIKPNERKACFGMGFCLNSKGNYSEAIPYLETAIRMEDTYTAAYVELGYSRFKTGKNTEALTLFNKAMQLNPQNENSRYYSGLVYISQNNKAKAQQMVNELKALNSKNAQSLQDKVNKM